MKTRRRRYIVSSGFQARFVVGFMTVALMGTILGTLLFSFFAVKRLGELQWSVFLNARSTGEVLEPLFLFVYVFDLTLFSALLLTTWIWIRRRINGPISHFSKALELMKEGDFSSSIILRRRDEFRDVAEALNDMLYRIREKFAELTAGYEAVSKALVELDIAQAKGIFTKEREERIILMIQNLRKKIPQIPGQT